MGMPSHLAVHYVFLAPMADVLAQCKVAPTFWDHDMSKTAVIFAMYPVDRSNRSCKDISKAEAAMKTTIFWCTNQHTNTTKSK